METGIGSLVLCGCGSVETGVGSLVLCGCGFHWFGPLSAGEVPFSVSVLAMW